MVASSKGAAGSTVALKGAGKVASKGYRVAALGDDKCKAKVRLLTEADRVAFTAGECLVVAGMAADVERRHVVGAVCAVEHRANMLAKADGFSIATPNCDALAAKVDQQGAPKVGRVVHDVDADAVRAYIVAALEADPKCKRTPTSWAYARSLGRAGRLATREWATWCAVWADVTADAWSLLVAEGMATGLAYNVDALRTWAASERPELVKAVDAVKAAKAKAAADAAKARKVKADAKAKAAAKAPKAVASKATPRKAAAKGASKPRKAAASKGASTRKPRTASKAAA